MARTEYNTMENYINKFICKHCKIPFSGNENYFYNRELDVLEISCIFCGKISKFDVIERKIVLKWEREIIYLT